MKKRPGGRIFDSVFDPTQQPGWQTRRISMDGLSKGVDFTYEMPDPNEENGQIVKDRRNLKEVLKSGTDAMTLPSTILRKKGF